MLGGALQGGPANGYSRPHASISQAGGSSGCCAFQEVTVSRRTRARIFSISFSPHPECCALCGFRALLTQRWNRVAMDSTSFCKAARSTSLQNSHLWKYSSLLDWSGLQRIGSFITSSAASSIHGTRRFSLFASSTAWVTSTSTANRGFPLWRSRTSGRNSPTGHSRATSSMRSLFSGSRIRP